MKPNKPILLVGMMGVGKSTVGAVLAPLLQLPFVDLDQQIEKEQGKTIQKIFEQEGEIAFRILEKAALEAILLRQDNPVVACGGGVLSANNTINAVLLERTLVFHLHVSISLLAQRVWQKKENRPLLKNCKTFSEGLLFLEQLYAQRQPFYKLAHHHFNLGNDPLSPFEIAARLQLIVAAEI